MTTCLERELRLIVPLPPETPEEAASRRPLSKKPRVIRRRFPTPLPRPPSTDFKYVLKDAEATNVSFGSNTPRNIGIYGKGAPHTRIIITVRRETDKYPHLGPAAYDDLTKTAFHDVISKATSIHGVGTGARRAQRFTDQCQEGPGPGEYYNPEPPPRQNPAPFNTSSQKKYNIDLNPGPGSYNGRRVDRLLWKYHFGLAPREPVPLVTMRCTEGQPIGKCFVCDEELPPGKEYWRNVAEKLLLCIRCMRLEKQAIAKSKFKSRFTYWQLQAFQRERDCTDYHEHEGTTAKIHLFPDSVIQKRLRLEAYLGRFFVDDGPLEDPDRDKRPAALGTRPELKHEDTDGCAYLKNRPDCVNPCLHIPSISDETTTTESTSHLDDLTCFKGIQYDSDEPLLQHEPAANTAPSESKTKGLETDF